MVLSNSLNEEVVVKQADIAFAKGEDVARESGEGTRNGGRRRAQSFIGHGHDALDGVCPESKGLAGPLEEDKAGCIAQGGLSRSAFRDLQQGFEANLDVQFSTDGHDARDHGIPPVRQAVCRAGLRDFQDSAERQREPFVGQPENEHGVGVSRLGCRGRQSLSPRLDPAFRGWAVQEAASGVFVNGAVVAVDDGREVRTGLITPDANTSPAAVLGGA